MGNNRLKLINILRTLASMSSICLLFTVLIFFNCKSTRTAYGQSDAQHTYNMVEITIKGQNRYIQSNSIPAHPTGQFPNKHNPNIISPQTVSVEMSLAPTKNPFISTSSATEYSDDYVGAGFATANTSNNSSLNRFTTIGIAVNGVLMEPSTAEVWDEVTKSRGQVFDVDNPVWNYDGLGSDRTGSFVGMDTNKGHVQPTGKYHYHSIVAPAKLYSEKTDVHSSLVAFAADGFPIFGPYGYNTDGSAIEKMYGNYKLKNGTRIAINSQNPEGSYDGTFTQDYEFAAGTADVDSLVVGDQTSILDQANGHAGKVPASELEKYNYDASYLGTKNADNTYTVYHYHLTDNYPYMPRQFYGTPNNSFLNKAQRNGANRTNSSRGLGNGPNKGYGSRHPKR